jgi:hypothetical protein
MEFLRTHGMKLLAGGGSGAALLYMAFKDSLKEWWATRRSERKMVLEAQLAASGKDDKMASAFIGLLKSDLESQAKTRDEMAKALGQLAGSMAQVLDTQRLLSNQINDLAKDMMVVKGAMMGRFQ